MNKPYQCVHGICTRNPSCFGGECPDKKPKPMAYQFPDGGRVVHIDSMLSSEGPFDPARPKTGMHADNLNYPYCAVGQCSLGCDSECVWAKVAMGHGTDEEFEEVLREGYILKGIEPPQGSLERHITRWHMMDAERSPPEIKWAEPQDPTTFNSKPEETMNFISKPEDKTSPSFTFVWGFPYDFAKPDNSIGESVRGAGRSPQEAAEAQFGKWRAEEAASKLRQPPVLSQERQERKDTPLCSGVLDYFPRALAYVAKVSRVGSDVHNPGEEPHWSKHKSTDHADCVVRHLLESTFDKDGMRHSGMLAWRALALLELELEAAGQGIGVEELIELYAALAEDGK